MDSETRKLDSEILAFICVHSRCAASDKDFNSLALKIFKYQFERNAPYRRWCRSEKKNPGNILHWKEIPAVPAAAFKRLRLACFPESQTRKIFRTSGTSYRTTFRGETLRNDVRESERGAHYFDTLKLYEAAIIPLFRRYLLPDDVRLSYFFLTPSPSAAPDSSLSHMMGVVNRTFAEGRGRFYVRGGRPDFSRLARDLAREKGSIFLLSTAFALKGFLDYLSEKKIQFKFPPGSRLMETGGFKGRTTEISKAALYRLCRRFLGVSPKRIWSEYGMTELSSQIYKGRGPAWLRVVVVDPRTGLEAPRGTIGLLRHVDFANRGSVMAVETEDLGRIRAGRVEFLGRAASADLRGCSLAFEEFLKR